MKAQINGLITSMMVRDKKRDGVIQKDSQGKPIKERKVMILDLEDDQAEAPYKINFDADQEDTIRSLLRDQVKAVLTVHQFNKFTFFRLVSFEGLS